MEGTLFLLVPVLLPLLSGLAVGLSPVFRRRKLLLQLWTACALLLSLAAVSMTLFGTFTMILNVSVPVAVGLLRKPRAWGHLTYILWASVFPALCGAVYVLR